MNGFMMGRATGEWADTGYELGGARLLFTVVTRTSTQLNSISIESWVHIYKRRNTVYKVT